MKRSTLEVLCCPGCRGALLLRDESTSEVVEAGSLVCVSCPREFPIEDGLPRFVTAEELSGLNRRFARFYDVFSYVYAPFSKVAFAFLGGEQKNRREVLDRLQPAGRRVLEVSIGPGVNLPYLIGAPGVEEVFGLDISLGQLRRCRSYCRRRGWAVDLFLGMAEALPFRDESFDSVLHIGGINFFSDKGKAMREMVRVARPGAKIVIADETEKGARTYEWLLPGFSRIFFEGRRETVTAPLDLVPVEMEDVRAHTIWRGIGYCIEFRRPERLGRG
jgi:ubiquinone/menaquinone biosynthesis C-methylase UbiE